MTVSCVRGSWMQKNASPPSPHISGFTTAWAKAAATAASMAFPPRLKISPPAAAARGSGHVSAYVGWDTRLGGSVPDTLQKSTPHLPEHGVHADRDEPR